MASREFGPRPKCFMNMCSNPARFRPVVKFIASSEGLDYHYPKSTMDVPLCKDHRHTIGASELFPLKIWTMICDGYKEKKMPVPEWEKTKVTFERIRR